MESEVVVLPHSPRPGESFDLRVTGIDSDGWGTAAIVAAVGPGGTAKRYTFKVPRGVPGDLVRFEVRKYRRGVVWGRPEVLEASPDRVGARCVHFDGNGQEPGCGGCRLQGMTYAHQLAIKHGWLEREFARAGLDASKILDVRAMDAPWFYRNKMEYSFADDGEHGTSLGLHPTGMKFDVLNLDACQLQSPEAMVVVTAVRRWANESGLAADVPKRRPTGFLRTLMVREGKRTGERMVVLVTTGAEVVETSAGTVPVSAVIDSFRDLMAELNTSGQVRIDSAWSIAHDARRGHKTTRTEHHLMGAMGLREELHIGGGDPLAFDVHPESFFQPNTLQAEVLYGEVIDAAKLMADDTVLDLYCGTGTIGLAMARQVREIHGVEIVQAAVDNARRNAEHNGIRNASFTCGDTEDYLAEHDGGPVDVVVIDPPRAGLSSRTMDKLLGLGADRVVYVSCRPSSLARDAVALMAGGYALAHVQPVDMFPHTAHLETVAMFRRVAPRGIHG